MSKAENISIQDGKLKFTIVVDDDPYALFIEFDKEKTYTLIAIQNEIQKILFDREDFAENLHLFIQETDDIIKKISEESKP